MTTRLSGTTTADTGAVTIPNRVNLHKRFEQWKLPVRAQGKRGTCSVFTVVGALEYAFASQVGKGTLLSVEFLNWAAHDAVNRRQDGGFFWELWEGYTKYGICSEEDMPYRAEFDPDLQPVETALERAAQTLGRTEQLHWIKEWNVTTGLTDSQLAEIKQTLAQGYPVCGGFRWPKEAVWDDGVLRMRPVSQVFDGHSVLLEGYRDDPIQPGRGAFIIRNSGGERRSGFLSYEYVSAYMNDAAWIESADISRDW